MATVCDFNEKPKINYPCKWEYKIIVDESVNVIKEVEAVLKDKNFKLEHSHKSSKGKYLSYNVSLEVQSEEERLEIYINLKKFSRYIL